MEKFFLPRLNCKMIITFCSLFIIYIIDLASKISHSGPTLLRLCYILSGSQSDINSKKLCSTQTLNPFSTIKLKNTPYLAKRFFFQDSKITCPYYKESSAYPYKGVVHGRRAFWEPFQHNISQDKSWHGSAKLCQHQGQTLVFHSNTKNLDISLTYSRTGPSQQQGTHQWWKRTNFVKFFQPLKHNS